MRNYTILQLSKKIECTTQSNIATACIIEYKITIFHRQSIHHQCTIVWLKWWCTTQKKGDRQISEGTFEIPQNTPKYMTKVIDMLRMPQVVKRNGLLPTTITTTEHIQGWKRIRKEQH